MAFKQYIVALFFVVFASYSLAAEQVEEGWRWKKDFNLQCNGQNHNVNPIHQKMADQVKGIYTLLSKLKDSDDLILPLRKYLSMPKNKEMSLIFKELNADDKSIADIFKEDSSGNLEKYWEDTEIDLKELSKGNDQILKILKQNLQRLCSRNIALAAIGTIIKGSHEELIINDPIGKGVAVFLSGTGNRLIELLEPLFFPGFTFITFDRPYGENKLYEGFLKGNLGYIFSHESERIPPELKKRSETYQTELDTYVAAQKDLEKKWLGTLNVSKPWIKFNL